jgi:hypothetical protein
MDELLLEKHVFAMVEPQPVSSSSMFIIARPSSCLAVGQHVREHTIWTMTPLMPVAGKELITRGTSEVIQKLEVAVPVTIDLLSEQHIIFIHDLCRVRCPPPSSFHLDLR